MTHVYIIRHAEAEGNLYRRVQGHYDGKVTPLGYRQIDALAERFRDIHIDVLYSSDLSRTQATARAITRYHELAINIEPELREVSMGVWENLPWGDVTHDEPEQMYAFNIDPNKWTVEGSEDFSRLRRRLRSIVTELAARHDGQTIALVSHGMAIRALLYDIMGIPIERLDEVAHGDNTSVSLLEVDGDDINIVFSNDNSHLDETTSTFARQYWWKEKTGSELNNLRFEVCDLKKDNDLYISCYADAWETIHGSAEGFEPKVYYKNAASHAAEDPRFVMKVLRGDEFIGLVDIDDRHPEETDSGWISLLYLIPEYRGRRFGVQLLGHAVAVFRERGRKYVRLTVAENNTRAIGFYEYYGFERIGERQGVRSTLILMEMKL